MEAVTPETKKVEITTDNEDSESKEAVPPKSTRSLAGSDTVAELFASWMRLPGCNL